MEEMMIRLLNMSFAAGCTAGIVAVMRLIFWRMPKGYSYALWLVVLFRFLCPVIITSPLSWLLVNPEPVKKEIIYQESPRIETGVVWIDQAVNHVMGESLAQENPANSANPIQIWLAAGFILWVTGAVIFIGYHVWQWAGLRLRLATAVQIGPPESGEGAKEGRVQPGRKQNRWFKRTAGESREERIPQRHGIKERRAVKAIPVWESDQIEGAFVMGLLIPAIYLPAGLSEEGREYILCHEEIHVKRKDYLIKLLGLGMVALHWFNPLAWLAFRLMCADMEMSCDEQVVQIMGREARENYSRVLLEEAQRQSQTLLPLAFGRSHIYLRIKNILNFRRPGRIVTWGMIILIAAAGIGLATSPGGKKNFFDKETTSLSIIGGADGPTSIFLAGKLPGGDEDRVWQKELPDKQWLESVVLDERRDTEGDSVEAESSGEKGSRLFLDFASENSLIFHGDFGLFSFNRNEKGDWKQQIFIRDVDTGSQLAEALRMTLPPGQEMSRETIRREDSFRLMDFRGPDSQWDFQVWEYSAAKMSDGRVALLGAILPEGEKGSLYDLFYGYYDPLEQVMTQVFLFCEDGQETINLQGRIRSSSYQ